MSHSVPHLGVIQVGTDPASTTYVNRKEKACQEAGYQSTILRLDASVSEQELLRQIDAWNHDEAIDGYIVQLPLPEHINEERIIMAIDPAKDVDGFHPVNMGRMMLGMDAFLPATPQGILTLLQEHHIETRGRHCVIIGRSNIVGRPLANLMSQRGIDCTVTLCHSYTRDLSTFTRMADILVTAVGQPGLITADMVRDGAVVIDVGMNRIPADTPRGYRLVGDVDYENVAPKCTYITPVPGGVGPMTIRSLLANTLRAANHQSSSVAHQS